MHGLDGGFRRRGQVMKITGFAGSIWRESGDKPPDREIRQARRRAGPARAAARELRQPFRAAASHLDFHPLGPPKMLELLLDQPRVVVNQQQGGHPSPSIGGNYIGRAACGVAEPNGGLPSPAGT